MTGPFALPVEYVVVDQGSEFEQNVQQDFDALALAVGNQTAGAGATIGAGTAPSFQNSWVAVVGAPAGYALVGGLVVLFGAVQSGSSASAVVFTLPKGLRPSVGRAFPVAVSTGTVAYCTVSANGDVYFSFGGSTTSSYLDGVIFRAEQ